ncbi:dyslexia-associated protein KIAA0319-like protein isoform X2 [Zootermopsis nevadensis]|uniref:dyslexia-associated protein KIAA0319-like protein isoform X2 n=1 Tax=Zootermopsis nevadensis TaxID=136037 RepID=UPI000B8EC76E|nr:dyslexia-associated protein KIAA0319-like protein isoform X2 [Zootermopsis nevadensis]
MGLVWFCGHIDICNLFLFSACKVHSSKMLTGRRNTITTFIYFVLWVWFLSVCLGHEYKLNPQLRQLCPRIYLSVFTSFAPRGNETAGSYSKKDDIHSLEDCITSCCEEEGCNVVFMHDSTCYQIMCITSELCAPLFRPEPKFGNHVSMILVQPVSPSETWKDIIESTWANDYKNKNSAMDLAEIHYNCEVGVVVDCPVNEVCVQIVKHSRNGICQCVEDYQRNSTGICTPVATGKFRSNNTMKTFHAELPAVTPAVLHPTKIYSEGELGGRTDPFIQEATTSRPIKQLVVSAISKEVRLPENEVTLSAYTVPAEQPGEHYKYEWTFLAQPEGVNSGIMNDQNGETLKLSHLIEGLYMFKVSVSAPGAYGETYANVTVLPPKHINTPPVAVISPSSQTVKLPNSGAVLDGSSSSDDDKIVSWHWELQQGPLGYQPHLQDTSTLQLDNLVVPGNYTFKLTVEDSHHVTNSTTANITVLKVTDYPPEANAGQDIIMYLPHNKLTLNGSLSTDDRGIASWEWTKSPSDQDKAVDMQNTRTPYLQLSNLEEGMYTFVLKVTDNSGQSSSAEVHVFVKPPTNKPPVANAGKDITVSLPQTWVLLDGSQSSDDIQITAWKWEQLGGPSKVVFSASNSSHTNVTELTKGEYEIQLTVTDDNHNNASDSVVITVTQNKNAKPIARAGEDQTVILPVSVIILNGSLSSDDLGIVKWEWIREPSSLALGRVIANSDHLPVLMLTDVVPGRYVFSLRVTDEQGETHEDTISVIVKNDPHLFHLVELTLNIEGHMLTKAQESSLEMKLSLLLRDEAEIHVRELRTEDHTGRAVIVFYVEQRNGKGVLPGPAVVARLKEKLMQDSGLLELSVANIQTTVCQNNCSGHGVCDQTTRQCLCEAFWMQNLITKHLGSGDSNCDWSILYVVIVLFVSILLVVGCGWGVMSLCHRACARRPHKRQCYSLLDEVTHGKIMQSESDSDSDILFESWKCRQNGDARNGHGKIRNGFVKPGRRIKT